MDDFAWGCDGQERYGVSASHGWIKGGDEFFEGE
jgi:hypothetical protein